MSIMLSEIHEQPDLPARIVSSEWDCAKKLARDAAGREIDLVVLAARGTSDHAAIYGKYLLEIKNSLPVALADPSIFTLYEARVNLQRALVIGVSQSGQAPDVIEYLGHSRESGALTCAITNVEGSPLSQAAEHTILCHAGPERGVAATKTYTATLMAFYLISGAIAGDAACCDRLLGCADAIQSVLAIEQEIASMSQRYRFLEGGAVISRGYNYCTALETALKLGETSYIQLRGYSAADFMHGPVAVIHEGYPCILIAPPGKTFDTMHDMAARLRESRADTLIMSSEDAILSHATVPVKMPAATDEELSAIPYIIPGQLLAQYLALARGFDPDRPRGLNKVTLTR